MLAPPRGTPEAWLIAGPAWLMRACAAIPAKSTINVDVQVGTALGAQRAQLAAPCSRGAACGILVSP